MEHAPHNAPHLSALRHALEEALGTDGLLQGDALQSRQTWDWSDTERHHPALLLLPRNTEQVAAALRLCHQHGQPLAVQGGLTGLVGGANPQHGEIALSLARMNQIEDLDAAGATALVQAGVSLQQLQDAAAVQGLAFPLDLGARGSCQLGGNAATNAGGQRVLRFGMMRNLVLGLEVVLPDGTVLTMLDRMVKNNAGFDLKQLFIGSEGTLGVITRLSLALSPLPAWQGCALCAVPDFPSALALLRQAKAALPGLSAFELMWQDYAEGSAKLQGLALPFDSPQPLYVLLESFAGSQADGEAALEALLASAMEAGLVRDAILAQSEAQTQQLWAYREGVSELLSHCKPCAAFDVSVAITRMDELVKALRSLLQQAHPAQQHLFFGHLGDGNLHLVSGPFPSEAAREQAEALVYTLVGQFGGSISAEHGIGLVKQPFLHHSRDAAQLHLMQQIKALLDPKAILNRGRVLGPSALGAA